MALTIVLGERMVLESCREGWEESLAIILEK